MKPYYDHSGITIYHGDCREILPDLEPVDLVLTDPPYGIQDGLFWRKNGDSLENWQEVGHNKHVDGWRFIASHKLNRNCSFVEFCSAQFERLFDVCNEHRACGLSLWTRYLLVKSTPAPTVRASFAPAFEEAIISFKGQRRWFGGGYVPNRWIGQSPNNANDSWGHPTEKPQEPINILISVLSGANEIVLDPFMGSGTTLRAAKDIGRQAIGIEIEEKYCEIAAKRLSQEVLAFV